ncbi:DnaB-like helicase C-terminal domain-containing protein, partial [Brachyspira hyodysenteriae]|uniref:DnaB-like helicase C-terminal domain-containing protein n=1 Tax=Brachyspira hyodysenteriae TaxID=159 RepID=UPI0022CD40CF
LIDKDLIVDKEDYLKNELINSLREKLNEINKSNIDNSILEIKNILKEFTILNEDNLNIEENILNDNTIEYLINTIVNTKPYNLEDTSFEVLKDFLKDYLITIGAESSVGKTSFVSQLALEILQKNDNTILAFYSLDDSKAFLTKKMILQLISNNKKKNNTDFIKLINKHKNDLLNILFSSRIAIFEKLNIYNLHNQLLKLKQNASSKLNIKEPRIIVVIDYLQIIDHDSSNLREGLNKVCSYLKDIQKKLNCMMILLSQFNRSKETNINTLIRYRETSEIENISDLCINLESINNQENYNTKLYIVKNKDGEKNKIFTSLRNEYRFSKFNIYHASSFIKNKEENIDNGYIEESYSEESIDNFIF